MEACLADRNNRAQALEKGSGTQARESENLPLAVGFFSAIAQEQKKQARTERKKRWEKGGE